MDSSGRLPIVAQRIVTPPPQELLNLIHNGVRIQLRLRVVSLVIGLLEAANIVRQLWVRVDLFTQRLLQLDGLLLNLLEVKG